MMHEHCIIYIDYAFFFCLSYNINVINVFTPPPLEKMTDSQCDGNLGLGQCICLQAWLVTEILCMNALAQFRHFTTKE